MKLSYFLAVIHWLSAVGLLWLLALRLVERDGATMGALVYFYLVALLASGVATGKRREIR